MLEQSRPQKFKSHLVENCRYVLSGTSELLGLYLLFNRDAFTQINLFLNETLVDAPLKISDLYLFLKENGIHIPEYILIPSLVVGGLYGLLPLIRKNMQKRVSQRFDQVKKTFRRKP